MQLNINTVTSMIDTIEVQPQQQHLIMSLADTDKLLENRVGDWVFNSASRNLPLINDQGESVTGRHRDSGFKARLEDQSLKSATASLPRVLGRPNGIQLKAPEDLYAARAAFMQRIKFTCRTIDESDLKLSRLDLVLNLNLNPRYVLPLHRNARHKQIRRETECYYNQRPSSWIKQPPHELDELNTVCFNGTNTRISLYDKTREICCKKRKSWPEVSPCTRVEIQLRGKKHIATTLGYGGREWVALDQLDFEVCYRAFRDILLGFDQLGALPTFQSNLVNCLAVMEQCPETWRLLGDTRPLDWYRLSKGVSDKHFRETRNKVWRQQFRLKQFRWSDHLPEYRLPDVVDIDEDGKPTMIANPYEFQGQQA